MSAGKDSLASLRAAIGAKSDIKILVDKDSEITDDITKGKSLLIGDDTFALDENTRFEVNDEPITLRTVYNAWLTRDLSIADYISASDERGIPNLRFLQRTDLITWLDGSSTESDNIKPLEGEAKPAAAAAAAAAEEADEEGASLKRPADAALLEEIYHQERRLIDHNKALRGNKNLDFSNVAEESRKRIISAFKKGARAGADPRAQPSASAGASSRNTDPIILISPSASSLINMSNVKDFLETGVFNPTPSSVGAANVQRISHASPRLGNLRFFVTDSVERFKPDYWNRVVAVFVTGQAWQLKPYQWSDPNVLFQRVLGFALLFKGDPIPPTLAQWNVTVETVERSQRFRDREVVQRIWDRIEQSMVVRGWTPSRRK